MREALIAHRFQEYTAIRVAYRRGFGIFARPGLGKTIIALRAVQIIKPKKVLIVAPISVIKSTWPDEIKKWDKFEGLTYNILRPKEYKQREALIDLVNPEALGKINPKRYSFLIVDESSLFKNPRSKRFRLLAKLRRYIPYCAILTGTPRPKSYLDLWSQMYLVDFGASLGKKFTAYRAKYFNTISIQIGAGQVFNKYEIKPGAEKLIQKAIRKNTIALDTAGLIEMPELQFNDIKLKLDRISQKRYDQMEKELFVSLRGEKVFAFSSGAAYGACHQLANGALYTKKPEFEEFHALKIEALLRIYEELNGSPLLVGYQYEHDRQRILKAIPEAEELSPKNVVRWNAGSIPVMLLQYQKAAYGLNLQSGGRDLALFSLTDNWANYDQLICRIYRQGAKKQVIIHRLITLNTVDEVIKQRLDRHQEGNSGLIEALRAYEYLKRSRDKVSHASRADQKARN